jgi:hypothetical protein
MRSKLKKSTRQIIKNAKWFNGQPKLSRAEKAAHLKSGLHLRGRFRSNGTLR